MACIKTVMPAVGACKLTADWILIVTNDTEICVFLVYVQDRNSLS
jgi:hypothetical protein